MLFDINTATGHWPFRQVLNQGIPELKRLLLGKGITGAAVVNTNGLFYQNCHDANIELAKAIERHCGFFVGVATLNPLYPAWERDLETCASELGLKALRLVPQYHNYRLDCPEVLAIVQKASSLKLPVFIPHRIIDIRGRHWMDTEQVVNLNEVGALCRAVPEAKVVFTEAAVNPKELVDERGHRRYPNLYFEISRFRSVMGQNIKRMVKLIGYERILFGSGAPFKEITPALLKLQHAALSPKEKNAVARQNAARILRLS